MADTKRRSDLQYALTFRVGERLKALLDQAVLDTEISVSEYARTAVREKLYRDYGMPRQESVGA